MVYTRLKAEWIHEWVILDGDITQHGLDVELAVWFHGQVRVGDAKCKVAIEWIKVDAWLSITLVECCIEKYQVREWRLAGPAATVAYLDRVTTCWTIAVSHSTHVLASSFPVIDYLVECYI
jgi:hypothetical protein